MPARPWLRRPRASYSRRPGTTIDPKPGGRHIVNAVYAGTVRGGTLAVGQDDKSLRDVRWQPLEALEELEMYPPIGAELMAICRENGSGVVRVLGNTWRPYEG